MSKNKNLGNKREKDSGVIPCKMCGDPSEMEITLSKNDYNDKEESREMLHLCRGCLLEKGSQISQKYGLPLETVKEIQGQVEDMMLQQYPQRKEQTIYDQNSGKKAQKGLPPTLASMGRDLTNLAKENKLKEVIGRGKEQQLVLERLNRKNKSNPVLIGEAGVGKSAIVESIAFKIHQGDVPEKMKNKKIVEISPSAFVQGAKLRGSMEERVESMVKELKNYPEIILFIDEIHNLVGAGGGEEHMDVANILKPALSRGDISVIGATTLEEYRKIEKDGALERRFQPIQVEEPSVEDSVEILKGLKREYEQYHNVQYTERSLEACVDWSKRYMVDQQLPDKAIDLMDIAGAKQSVNSNNQDIEELNQNLKNRMNEIDRKRMSGLLGTDYKTIESAHEEEQELMADYREKYKAYKEKEEAIVIDREKIAQIIEEQTGVPVSSLEKEEKQKLRELKTNLNQYVIGQEEAIEKITRAIQRSRVRIKESERPTGSFLFVGPTGVGKTEMAKTLANELFGTEDAMVRLDMSEYMEPHSVAKLIGSPPGYKGYGEGGQLTEKVRRRPYGVLLIDELEKAHPDVLNMFLQLLEDGMLTDSEGKSVSFKEMVVIMTSNAEFEQKNTLGFASDEYQKDSDIVGKLKETFKPEFLNRLDHIVPFAKLKEGHLKLIVDIHIEELRKGMEVKGIDIDINEEVRSLIAKEAANSEFGARPIRRSVQEYVEDQIVERMLDEKEVKGVRMIVRDNRVKLIDAAAKRV